MLLKLFKRNNLKNFNLKYFCDKEKSDFCFTQKSILYEKENNNDIINSTNNSAVIAAKDYKLNIRTAWKNLSELSKFKLCLLNTSVSMSTYAFYTTTQTTFDYFLFGAGTLLISMNTQVLNQIIEKIYDKQMKRTNSRPLPKQRISDNTAKFISAGLWTLSTACYSLTCPNAILFSNSILTLYIMGYTPLKRISNLSMHMGALVGALPALLGSFAATGMLLTEESLLLAAYIFAWQYPHFYGILYQNKEDYMKAGFKFISNDETKNWISYIQMIIAMIAIMLIVWRLYKKGIMNKSIFMTFVIFYIINIIPVLKFIKDPTKYAKIIRVKSYTPFMIVILSFVLSAANRKK